MTDRPSFLQGLTKAQVNAFDQIAAGNFSGIPVDLANALLSKNLIETIESTSGQVLGYFVPLHYHIPWCAWCAENYKEEDDLG